MYTYEYIITHLYIINCITLVYTYMCVYRRYICIVCGDLFSFYFFFSFFFSIYSMNLDPIKITRIHIICEFESAAKIICNPVSKVRRIVRNLVTACTCRNISCNCTLDSGKANIFSRGMNQLKIRILINFFFFRKMIGC